MTDIHDDPTGVQAFDVTPHLEPQEPRISQPLNAPAPPQPQPQQPQPQPQEIPASYQSIIEQQNEQIAALMAQNQALNGQITQMVQSGAQFAPQSQPQQAQHYAVQPQQAPEFPNVYEGKTPLQQYAPPSLASDQDWSLEALGREIGKKD